MIRTPADAASATRTKTFTETPVQKPGRAVVVVPVEQSGPPKELHADVRKNREKGEAPVSDSAVVQKAGVNTKAGSPGLDLRIREATRTHDVRTVEKHLGLSTPPVAIEARPDFSAADRLRMLVDSAAAGTASIDVGRVVHMMKSQLGPKAAALSHREIADALGLSGQSDSLKALGEMGLAVTKRGERPHFRLAVRLAVWMESLDFTATRAEAVKTFLAAHPGVAEQFPHLDADFLALLQRAFPFMPQWAQKPTRLQAPPSGVNVWLDAANRAHETALRDALGDIAKLPLSLRVTDKLAARLEQEQCFANHNVVMVQHMLGQALPLVDALVRAGMDAKKAEYVGVPYQESPPVQVGLDKTFEIPVTVPERGNIDGMWDAVCASIDRAYERHLKNGEPILVIDDGGYASKYICEKYAHVKNVFRVEEQTTRGLTEIAKLQPHFGIANVGGAHGKRFESNQIGDVVVHAVRKVLDVVSTTPARKHVLVVGAGKVGAAVATSFRGDGAKVTIFDPFISKRRQKELEAKGFTVITDKAEALRGKFLVVGCSGHRSIDMNDFVKLSSPVFMASASSKRVEIDTLGITKLSTDDENRLMRVLAGKVGEQETWHYFMKDGRIVTMLADGLPVNFQGVNSVAPELIDHTIALLLLGAAQAVKFTASDQGLITLDHRRQWHLQMEMDGIRHERESTADVEIEAFGEKAYGTREEWLDVARSPATPPAVVLALYQTFASTDPLDPIALACLSSEHDADSALVANVLERSFLPHIARVLFHEGISGGEQDRILNQLSLAVEDFVTGKFIGALSSQPIAVDVDARGGHRTRRFDPTTLENRADGKQVVRTNQRSPTGQLKNDYGKGQHKDDAWEEVRNRVLGQLAAILLSHPRVDDATIMTFFMADLPTRLRDVRAANVLALRRASWTGEMLERLLQHALPDLRALPEQQFPLGVDGEPVSTELRARYVQDVLVSFRDHKNATPALKAKAEHELAALKAWAGNRFDLSGEEWPESPVLGIPLPEYR